MRFFKQERLNEIIIYKVEKVMKDIELLILFMTVCDLMEWLQQFSVPFNELYYMSFKTFVDYC
jgi:hypothetical protein